MTYLLKSILLFSTVIFTGLSAGLFYAWSVSVIPGTKKVADLTYLQVMQSINRAILNPAFFLIFFGSLILLGLATGFLFRSHPWAFGLMLAATISYLLGTVGVTAWGNVPLNDQLEAMNIAAMSADKVSSFRDYYEAAWNGWHRVRTVFALLSFITAATALFIHIKKY